MFSCTVDKGIRMLLVLSCISFLNFDQGGNVLGGVSFKEFVASHFPGKSQQTASSKVFTLRLLLCCVEDKVLRSHLSSDTLLAGDM